MSRVRDRLLTQIADEEARLAKLELERERASARLEALREQLAATSPGVELPDRLRLPTTSVPTTPQEKVALFRALFRGREDVMPPGSRARGPERLGTRRLVPTSSCAASASSRGSGAGNAPTKRSSLPTIRPFWIISRGPRAMTPLPHGRARRQDGSNARRLRVRCPRPCTACSRSGYSSRRPDCPRGCSIRSSASRPRSGMSDLAGRLVAAGYRSCQVGIATSNDGSVGWSGRVVGGVFSVQLPATGLMGSTR